MAIEVVKPVQPLAALQVRKQRLVQRVQLARVKFIETFAKIGIARRPFDPVECVQIRPRRRCPTVVLEL